MPENPNLRNDILSLLPSDRAAKAAIGMASTHAWQEKAVQRAFLRSFCIAIPPPPLHLRFQPRIFLTTHQGGEKTCRDEVGQRPPSAQADEGAAM